MKYYKNLFKRKNYFAIIISPVFFLFGIAVIYFNSIQVIIEGIKESGLPASTVINNGLAGLLGNTNLGMVILGIIMLYLGLVFLPRNSYGSQDDSDYIVESQGDMLYIKYKNNEFLVKKETFGPTDLFFKDKNKKFVSLTTGYQIYNYVQTNHNILTEKEIDNNKVIKVEEIYKKFSNVHTMTIEDKKKYLSYKKINNKIRPFFLILTVILGLFTALMVLGIIGIISSERMSGEEIINIVFAIIITITSFIITKQSYKATLKNKKTTEKIMNSNLYYANCYSYDKKIVTGADTDGYATIYYYVKVTDNNYIINQWIEVSKDVYSNNDVINIWLVFDETGKDILEIVGLV